MFRWGCALGMLASLTSARMLLQERIKGLTFGASRRSPQLYVIRTRLPAPLGHARHMLDRRTSGGGSMAHLSLKINGRVHDLDVDPATPLLWVLRDELSLRGTKFGCGIGACGACTVLVDGKATRSCQLRASAAAEREIVTIEGAALSAATREPHRALRDAWLAEDVSQCGYCQTGQLMSAIALLTAHPRPTDAQIESAMTGNICRCGMYQRIRTAIHRASADRGLPAASSPKD